MPTVSLSAHDGQFAMDLPVMARTLDLVVAQLARFKSADELAEFLGRIGARLDEAIPLVVEPALRSPTKAQIAVATRVSTELGMALTPDVLRYQEAMEAFLAQHVDKLSLSRSRSASSPRPRSDRHFATR